MGFYITILETGQRSSLATSYYECAVILNFRARQRCHFPSQPRYSLGVRTEQLRRSFYCKNVINPASKLNNLMPDPVTPAYNFKNARTLPLFKCFMKRFQSSFFTIICKEMDAFEQFFNSSHETIKLKTSFSICLSSRWRLFPSAVFLFLGRILSKVLLATRYTYILLIVEYHDVDYIPAR